MDGAFDPLRIFISYRREDASGHAGRLYDQLAQHFQGHQIFFDLDIEPGADFVVAIERAVGSCDVLIVLIGKAWLNAPDGGGRSRLNDPRDFVRLEVATALERDVVVIPALVQGAVMPREDELPEPLARLSRRNAAELSDSRWNYDVTQLINSLERVRTAGLRPPGGQPGTLPAPRTSPSRLQEPRGDVADARAGRPPVGAPYRQILSAVALLIVVSVLGFLAFRAWTSGSAGPSGTAEAHATAGTEASATSAPSAIGTNQVAALPGSTATPNSGGATPSPASASAFDALRGFSGRALVAPRGLKPFSDYSLSAVGYPYTLRDLKSGYSVAYGDQAGAHATITGFTGRTLFDQANAPQTMGCASDAPYCEIDDVFGLKVDGKPTEELFRGLSVGPHVAIAIHNICCENFNSWTSVWFDATANTAYQMVIVYNLPAADQYGGTSLGENNLTTARMLADVGRQLVPAP